MYMFIEETLALALRSLLKLRRNSIHIFFSMFMPMIWLLMFSQVFARTVEIPAFQENFAGFDYVGVFLPAVLIMTAIQSASQSGFSLVADIEHGTMSRLMSTPMNRLSYQIGKMLADGARLSVQATVLLLAAFVLKVGFGWNIPFAGGFLGALVMIVLTGVFGVSFAGLSNTVAIRSRNTEATMMISFSFTFPLLFLSTSLMPEQLLPENIATITAFNPVTYVADALRALCLYGFDLAAIGKAFGVCALLSALLHGVALYSFLSQEQG